MRPYRIGLTGGLATGKSTVARWLAEAGFFVVDADEVVAALYEPDEPGARVIAELLGEEYLDARGAVDRQAVAQRVFHEPELRRRLEERVHPLVRTAFPAMAEGSDAPAIVLEATLLVEAGYAPDFDLVVTVESEPAVQLARAVARGLSHEQAEARLRAQGDGAERRAAADRVLRNDGTLDDLRREVDQLVEFVHRQRDREGET